MQIFDCFLFCDELELLELRLETLWSLVDHFVLVESPRTFSNLEKPLYYNGNKELFKKYESKIIHVIADLEWPEVSGELLVREERFKLEADQRNEMMKGLKSAAPFDVIMLSDVDEILNPDLFWKGQRLLMWNKFVTFQYKHYYYYFNGRRQDVWWHGALTCKMKTLRESGLPIGKLFLKRKEQIPTVGNSGWHFAYLGGPERIVSKLGAYSHAEFDKPKFKDLERIQKRIDSGLDLYCDTNCPIGYERLDETYPRYLLENQEKYKEFIWQ